MISCKYCHCSPSYYRRFSNIYSAPHTSYWSTAEFNRILCHSPTYTFLPAEKEVFSLVFLPKPPLLNFLLQLCYPLYFPSQVSSFLSPSTQCEHWYYSGNSVRSGRTGLFTLFRTQSLVPSTCAQQALNLFVEWMKWISSSGAGMAQEGRPVWRRGNRHPGTDTSRESGPVAGLSSQSTARVGFPRLVWIQWRFSKGSVREKRKRIVH